MPLYLKQTPHLVEKVWGGENLNYKSATKVSGPIGESWEISTLEQGESMHQGQPLSHLIKDHDGLDFLVKIIDTADNLSVQVHPDDQLAAELENSSGKTECWYILAAEPGAQIYLGLKSGVDKKQFPVSYTHLTLPTKRIV